MRNRSTSSRFGGRRRPQVLPAWLAAAACLFAGCPDGASEPHDVPPAEAEDGNGDAEVPTEAADTAEERTEARDATGEVGTCDEPLALACGDRVFAQTTNGAASGLTGYACASGLDEEGPENVFVLRIDRPGVMVTATMSPTGSADLDLWALRGTCAPASCAFYSAGTLAETVRFTAEVDVPYYLAVDGFRGAAGPFVLDVACTSAEICDNGADDTADGLTDCEDSECWEHAACLESCTGGIDEDRDGLIDCADSAACAEAPNCFESDCADGLDNDGDTRTDCEEADCLGHTRCATGDGQVGDPCSHNTDCALGACVDEPTFGWPGGSCIGWSDTDDCARLACPAGTNCRSYVIDGRTGWACLDPCPTDGSGCRPGYTCLIYVVDGISGTACVPECTSGDPCVATRFCGAGGRCVMPPEQCADDGDNDGDGLADCVDPDCFFEPACVTPTPLAGGGTCADAAEIALPEGERGTVEVTGTLSAADGDEHGPSCVFAADSVDVAYAVVLHRASRMTVELSAGPESPALTEPTLSLVRACGEPDLRCSSSFAGRTDRARVDGVFDAGRYILIVDGRERSLGSFALGVHLAEP